jgi:hypothetical protein
MLNEAEVEVQGEFEWQTKHRGEPRYYARRSSELKPTVATRHSLPLLFSRLCATVLKKNSGYCSLP